MGSFFLSDKSFRSVLAFGSWNKASVDVSDKHYIQVRSGQVRSGQVRLECLTYTFKASYCSAHLSQAHFMSFIRDRIKKSGGGSKGGPPALAGTYIRATHFINLLAVFLGMNE